MTSHRPAFLSWLEPHWPDAPATLVQAELAAAEAALKVAVAMQATVIAEPGNGWIIPIIVTAIEDPRFPGNLLISLPESHACLLLNMPSLHTPGYVSEKLRSVADSIVTFLAVFATLLDEALAAVAAGVPTEAP